MAEQAHERVEKIEKLDMVQGSKPVADLANVEEVHAQTKVKFEGALDRAETKWDQAKSQQILVANDVDSVPKLSPIAEMSMHEKRIERLQPITVEQIVKQSDDLRSKVQDAISQIESLQDKNAQVAVSPGGDAILTDKFLHVEKSLGTTLGKVGVEVAPQEIAPPNKNPLVKYLNYLTNSDNQLNTLIGEIQSMDPVRKRMQPEQLLAIQVKINFVQQQIEFFTNVLNKAVEGTKTIMNVQV